MEIFADFFMTTSESNIGHHYGEKFYPLLGTIFLYILTCNLFGLIPGFESPTSNINMTASMAIPVFLIYQFYGFKVHGLAYLKHFLGPMLVLAPLMFLIEMIGNFARALSLSMRLYGNIFGEHTAGSIFAGLVPIVVPWPMMALGLFTALLQAYVFTLLTTVYLGGATAHEH